MDINLNVTHRVDPELLQLFRHFLALAGAPTVAPAEAPAPKRRKAAAEPEAALAAATPPPPQAYAPPAAAPAPQLAPVPTAKVPGAGPTVEDVAKMVAATMERIGVPAMRAVFKQFPGVGRVLDLKPEQLPAFCAALQAAEQMVATS